MATSNITDDSAAIEYTLDIKIAQIFVVLIFSFIGMTGPLYFSKRINVATMFLLRAFAAGVILGLAFCHMVPDSAGLAELTEYGGLNGALILLGFILNLCTERLSIDLAQRKQVLHDKQDSIELHETMETGDLGFTESPATAAQHRVLEQTGAPVENFSSAPNTQDMESIQKLKESKAVITAHVVEVGVIVHTVILGISVGTWMEGRASLIIFTVAMAFHQFFEGIGLGAIVSAASGISLTKRAAMVAAFTLSFPLSICAGIAISYHTSDPTTDELIAGVFESIACGLLIYIGAVSFVAEDFFTSAFVNAPENVVLRWRMKLALCGGMATMAIIGIWG